MRIRRLPAAVAIVAVCAGSNGIVSADAGESLTLAIAKAKGGMNDSVPDQPEVVVSLTEPSREAFARLTTTNVGKFLSVSIDGAEMVRPKILTPIVGGGLVIFVPDNAEARARRLSDGRSTVVVTVLP